MIYKSDTHCASRVNGSGFSLVEISIVLVILGLLTGGILTGQSLIRAAELRSITTELTQYKTAVRVFQSKYFALAGDMTNASDFWASATNGNGDGFLDEGTEGNYFWHHLNQAGLINGNYDGSPGGSVAGVNVPASKISDAGWHIEDNLLTGGVVEYALNISKSYLEYGRLDTVQNDYDLPVIKPIEAWGIDKKIDDGTPARGNVVARYWNNQCAEAVDGSSAPNDLDARYRVQDDSIQCALDFLNFY